MSVFSKVEHGFKEIGTVAKDVGEIAVKDGPAALQLAGTAFGGPVGGAAGTLAGDLLTAIVNGITKHAATTGTTPNATQLKSSIGQVIDGVIGLLQATGKLPTTGTLGTVLSEVEKVAVAGVPAASNVSKPTLPSPPTIG